jgi:hypothetical protein
MRIAHLLPFLFTTLFTAIVAHAEVIVLDKDDWKIGIGGIAEFDAFTDSKGFLTESPGNVSVPQTGYDTNVGRTQFSIRNSRFSISAVAPEQDGIKTRGYLEFDLLGYDPNPNDAFAAGGPANSEGGFYSNPTLRVRHAYVAATHESHQLLVGQTWSVFGWQPNYVLSTISVQPVSGTMYERTQQIAYMNTQNGDVHSLQSAISISRPNERNSMIPNVEAGVRWSYKNRKSGFAAANSDIKIQPLSVAVSGAVRSYTVPTSATDAVQNGQTGAAFAVDAQVPLLAADGDSSAGSLTLTAEYTSGTGYGDEFSGWSGGLPQLVNKGAPANPNLDKGLGGFDASGNFHLVQLDSVNVQLQYHLSRGFFDVGYGLLHSNNIGSINTANPYDRAESLFVNYLHNFTKQLRAGLEYAQFTTHFAGGTTSGTGSATDNREMLATYYRF